MRKRRGTLLLVLFIYSNIDYFLLCLTGHLLINYYKKDIQKPPETYVFDINQLVCSMTNLI